MEINMNEYNVPDIRMDITSIPIEDQQIRKIDMGKFPVCSKCGANLLQWRDEKGELPCPCGGERITLRKYVTEVLKKEFNADEWKFVDAPDIVCLNPDRKAKVEVVDEN